MSEEKNEEKTKNECEYPHNQDCNDYIGRHGTTKNILRDGKEISYGFHIDRSGAFRPNARLGPLRYRKD